jgi:hypothetical protein
MGVATRLRQRRPRRHDRHRHGRPTLYHNNGNGTSTTLKARLDIPGWTTSAVWFDYDHDGKLDLSSAASSSSRAGQRGGGDNKLGRRYYCIPRVFKTPSLLFKNNGNGTFTKTSTGTDTSALGRRSAWWRPTSTARA